MMIQKESDGRITVTVEGGEGLGVLLRILIGCLTQLPKAVSEKRESIECDPRASITSG